MNITVRFAAPSDAAKLVSIYRPYVEETAVTFEYDTPSVAEFAARIREYGESCPYLVAECDGEPVGYAYAHQYGVRHAFRFSAELSIYVKRDFTGGGVGKRLYGALIELLTLQGFKNLYALVSLPNDASVALHNAFGFTEVGRERGVGYKVGRWIDLATLELAVGEHTDTDERSLWNICPKKLSEIDVAEQICAKYSD